MSDGYHIVVCAGIVPDPLQTLEPIKHRNGPALKNEMMLPAVLDPWACTCAVRSGESGGSGRGQQGLAG